MLHGLVHQWLGDCKVSHLTVTPVIDIKLMLISNQSEGPKGSKQKMTNPWSAALIQDLVIEETQWDRASCPRSVHWRNMGDCII